MNDAELLATLEHKLQLVRDRVHGVARGFRTGFHLWGEPGTSKTYTVEETLKEAHARYLVCNGRLSGKRLFQVLQEGSDLVHVLDDVETLFKDENALGVLRSALWGQQGSDGRQHRLVTWGADRMQDQDRFVFTGGLVLITNCPLSDDPRLRAIKTRISSVRYEATDEEVAAKMRAIAGQGHRHGEHRLSPAKCLEVAAAVIDRSRQLQHRLNLRSLVNAFQDRLQWEHGEAATHWLDLLDSELSERVLPPGEQRGTRTRKNEHALQVARRIKGLPTLAEKLKVWLEEVGTNEKTMYRWLGQVG